MTRVCADTCETAAGGAHEDTLLGFFRGRNATAIIGSETLMPDPLAAQFAIHFYYELLRSKPISTAVPAARRKLLEDFHSEQHGEDNRRSTPGGCLGREPCRPASARRGGTPRIGKQISASGLPPG